MLISTYNPESTATCPQCGTVKCFNTGGNLAWGRRYLDFFHEDCGVRWRQYMDGGFELISVPALEKDNE